MNITVAICTWNRARLLDQTLAAMRKLQAPAGVEWELLVVNNNCTDDTDAVIAQHQSALPIRRLLETKQGHSHARNCAIDAARGEMLIWTDDDVLVDPDWLVRYVEAAQAYPQAGYFGGTVDPWFEVDPPAWIRRHLAELANPYVIRQHGSAVRVRGPADSIAGANMAFRTAVMREFLFNTRLGRHKDMLVSADDGDVLRRIKNAGHQGIWVGNARVRHFIPAERLTAGFLWRWHVGAGHTLVRQEEVDLSGSRFAGVPRWVLRQYLQERVQSWLFAPLRSRRWLLSYLQAARWRGVMEACRGMTRHDRGIDDKPQRNAVECGAPG